MAVPKVIHLCWFGQAKMSDRIQSCVRSIYSLEKHGYQVRLWDESNYDVHASACVQRAYEQKRWSLVSNYARLDILEKHGGIYLDTDVEVTQPFDELLHNEFFLGFMWDCTLGTAVLGSVPSHKIVRDILARYNNEPASFKSPNNDTFTEYFLEHVPGFRLNGQAQMLNGISVGNKYMFEHPALFKRGNYAVHHFEQSWKPNSPAKTQVKALVIKLFSLWLYRKYVCWKSLRISPFYSAYLAARTNRRAQLDCSDHHT
jgi:hypothetical protein